MQTASSALALIVRFTYSQVANTLAKMSNMIIKRHNMASVLIVQALQKGPCGDNQIAYTDIGSADKLVSDRLRSEKLCQQNTALLLATKTNSTCCKSLSSSWRYPIFT